MSEIPLNAQVQKKFTSSVPKPDENRGSAAEILPNKTIFEQQLDFQINACNPGEGQLYFCFGLPLASPITLDSLTQAKEKLITKFDPTQTEISYHNPKLTSKAEGFVRLINKIYDYAQKNLFHQGVATTTNIAAAYEASLTTQQPLTAATEVAVQPSINPTKETVPLTEEQKASLLNRSKSIDELRRLIDSFGGLNWNKTVNSGDSIYNLFSFLIKQTSPSVDSLLVFPPMIREKIKEFYYQSKIESATSQTRLEQIILSIGSFTINNEIYSAQEILQRLSHANFALDPVLDYYGLKKTFSKIRKAQHDHFSDKPNTYYTVSGEERPIPPHWGN